MLVMILPKVQLTTFSHASRCPTMCQVYMGSIIDRILVLLWRRRRVHRGWVCAKRSRAKFMYATINKKAERDRRAAHCPPWHGMRSSSR